MEVVILFSYTCEKLGQERYFHQDQEILQSTEYNLGCPCNCNTNESTEASLQDFHLSNELDPTHYKLNCECTVGGHCAYYFRGR